MKITTDCAVFDIFSYFLVIYPSSHVVFLSNNFHIYAFFCAEIEIHLKRFSQFLTRKMFLSLSMNHQHIDCVKDRDAITYSACKPEKRMYWGINIFYPWNTYIFIKLSFLFDMYKNKQMNYVKLIFFWKKKKDQGFYIFSINV